MSGERRSDDANLFDDLITGEAFLCRRAGQDPAPALVPDAVIDDIRRCERDGAVESRQLRVGGRVRTPGGPFRDHLGLCTGVTA